MPRSDVESIYRSEHERLWRSLLAFSGDAEIASDASAEAFAQLLARGSEIRDARAWLWRSAYRIAGGLLQRTGHVLQGHVDPAIEDDPSLIELFSILGGLSDQQRACIILRHVGGFSGREIAGLLGTTEGTVRVQIHRAHSALRVSLEAP